MTPKLLVRHLIAGGLYYSGALGRLAAKANPSWRILMYHRVINPDEEEYPLQPGMYVRPETFRRHVQYLSKNCNVVPLDHLVSLIDSRAGIPPKTVAITFDDGWADNYRYAFPILKEFRMPATIFLITSYIGTNGLLWTDKVTFAITALAKQREHLGAATSRLRQTPGINPALADSILSLIDPAGGSPGQNLPAPRLSQTDAFEELILALKTDPQQRDVIKSTLVLLAQEFAGLKIERRFMTWDEVTEMTNYKIGFASHTHTHKKLTELSPVQITDELANSFQAFRDHSITPQPVFCYPEGAFSFETQQQLAAKKVRYVLAASDRSDLAANPHVLGRIGMHQDISSSTPLFAARTWLNSIF